jgi:hypothetical protein
MSRKLATVRDGKLEFAEPLDLPNGTQVEVELSPLNGDKQDPFLWMIENAVDTGIPDLAERHDYYAVHGTPELPVKKPKKRRAR